MTNLLSKNVEALAESIQWFGQAAIKIQYAGKIIYIDPYVLKSNDKADLVLITHPHFDHFSEGDIKRVASEETTFYCPNELVDKIKNLGYDRVIGVAPEFESEWRGIIIKAVPAYNITKTDKHPKEKKWVGYLLSFGHVTVYHTGDTERIPEMKDINCDIILLPLGHTYTMNSINDAVKTVIDTNASVAIPIHYGMYEGKAEDAENFKKLLEEKVEVIIPVIK
jgi:L-ascorbate metabolism protein UlaG (beta-lactamase superfamily)